MTAIKAHRVPDWLRQGRPMLVLLGLLLLLMVTAILGVVVEARRAANGERMAAERSSREVSSYAAWSIMTAAESLTEQLLEAAFWGLGTDTASHIATVPSLSELLANMSGLKRRTMSTRYTIRADTFFRYDARTNDLDVSRGNGRALPAPVWLRDSVQQVAKRFGMPFTMALIRDSVTTYAMVLTAQRTKEGKVIGALGFVAEANSLSAGLFEFMNSGKSSGLLPANIARGLPNDSLFAVQLTDQHGVAVWSTHNWRNGLRADTAGFFPRLASLVLHVAVPPEALKRLALVPRSSWRLPFFVVLLSVAAILGLLVLRQMKREYDLARVRVDFTAGVSHELRTPLAQILLYGETLTLGRARSDAERHNAAHVIVMESRRLMHMVENVLHLASADRNVTRTAAGTVQIGAVISDVLAQFTPMAEAERVAIVAEIDLSAAARGDTSTVRQILLNLLENAVKYGPAGQTIRVTCRPVGDAVEMCVEDEGPGVALGDRERIWKPFVRVSTPGVQPTGTGIGLAVVRDLAERCGATAFVADMVSETGAKFVVRFRQAV